MKVELCVNGAVVVNPWLTDPMPLSIDAVAPLNWARSTDFWPDPTFAGAASKNATTGAATSVADFVPAVLLSGVVGFEFDSITLSVRIAPAVPAGTRSNAAVPSAGFTAFGMNVSALVAAPLTIVAAEGIRHA